MPLTRRSFRKPKRQKTLLGFKLLALDGVPEGTLLVVGKQPEEGEYRTEAEFWALWASRSAVVKNIGAMTMSKGSEAAREWLMERYDFSPSDPVAVECMSMPDFEESVRSHSAYARERELLRLREAAKRVDDDCERLEIGTTLSSAIHQNH